MLLIGHYSPFSYSGHDAGLGMRWAGWPHEAGRKCALSWAQQFSACLASWVRLAESLMSVTAGLWKQWDHSNRRTAWGTKRAVGVASCNSSELLDRLTCTYGTFKMLWHPAPLEITPLSVHTWVTVAFPYLLFRFDDKYSKYCELWACSEGCHGSST